MPSDSPFSGQSSGLDLLWVGARTGSFEALYKEAFRISFLIARGILKDHGEAEDVAQECCIKIWRLLPGETPESVVGLITFMAVNGAIDKLRKRQGRAQSKRDVHSLEELHEKGQEPVMKTRNSEETLISAFLLRDCLSRLEKRWREAILLLHLGMSYDEMSTKMGIPQSTSKNWVHRGRQYLRECLNGKNEKIRTPPPSANEVPK